MERQTYNIQTDRQEEINGQKDEHTDGEKDIQTDIGMDRQTQTDIKTKRQTNGTWGVGVKLAARTTYACRLRTG